MNIEEGKALNHFIHFICMEQRIIRLLKSSSLLYVSSKVQVSLEDQVVEFQVLNQFCMGLPKSIRYWKMEYHHIFPILSAIGTPTDKLSKFCDQLLKPLTNNDYTIKDSFSFTKVVVEFDTSLFMANFYHIEKFRNYLNKNIKT